MSLPKPYFENDRAIIYHADCLEILPHLSGIDCVVTDPPYGMNYDTDLSGFNGWSGKGHVCDSIVGDSTRFDPSPFLAVGRTHIFWGAQYFCHSLPERGGWLVFNKRGYGKESKICFGDCELAWCDRMQSVRMYSQTWHGVSRWSTEGRLHPTQKPTGLMKWCIGFTEGGTILDPFMGSGTTGVACMKLGRKFIGIEIELKYVEIAAKRIAEASEWDALLTSAQRKETNAQTNLHPDD